MQRLVEAAIVVLALGTIVALSGRRSGYLSRHPGVGRLVVGLTVGLMGAFLVLVPETDLIPDSLEGILEPIFIIGVTAIAVVGSVARFVNR